jgi:iron complex transport system substrate-binding protein
VARRVVSLSPSTTETLFAIGARDALVGRSRYCDYPPEVLAVPEVGGYVDPSFEVILALRPDLVTGARGPSGREVADRFRARGIATYFPDTESFDQIDEMMTGLGARTGHVVEAQAAVAKVHERLADVERGLKGKPRVRTLLVFGLEPIVAAGPKSFADEMIRRAGGDNVVRAGGKYPTLGMERVLALDPDLVVDAAIGESRGVERIGTQAPGWREARAIKTGHVVTLDDEVVLRPGPRIGDGLATLAHAIHPEVHAGEAP